MDKYKTDIMDDVETMVRRLIKFCVVIAFSGLALFIAALSVATVVDKWEYLTGQEVRYIPVQVDCPSGYSATVEFPVETAPPVVVDAINQFCDDQAGG